MWIIFSSKGGEPTLWPTWGHFMATWGPKIGHHCPKGNHFWTLTQQVSTKSLCQILCILFQILVGNHHFGPFSVIFAIREPRLGHHRPKVNHFWTLTKQMPTLNLKWEITFPDNGQRPWMVECTDGRPSFLCPHPTLAAGTKMILPLSSMIYDSDHWLLNMKTIDVWQ